MLASLTRNLSLAGRGLRNYHSSRPLSVSFEVTHCCNAKCKHCHIRGMIEEDRASPEKLGQVCRELSPVVAQATTGLLLCSQIPLPWNLWMGSERAVITEGAVFCGFYRK